MSNYFATGVDYRHLGHAFDGRTCIGVLKDEDVPHSMDMCEKPLIDNLRRPVAPATVQASSVFQSSFSNQRLYLFCDAIGLVTR